MLIVITLYVTDCRRHVMYDRRHRECVLRAVSGSTCITSEVAGQHLFRGHATHTHADFSQTHCRAVDVREWRRTWRCLPSADMYVGSMAAGIVSSTTSTTRDASRPMIVVCD